MALTGTFLFTVPKGVVERSIRDVVFSLDECRSNVVVFRFDNIDIAQNGQPVFCSKEKLHLVFGNTPEVDKAIDLYMQNNQSDYTDSIKTISFAHSDSVYFAYSDDFNWNLGTHLKNYFPSRAVYVKRNDNKYYIKWALGLDLFGIPCD